MISSDYAVLLIGDPLKILPYLLNGNDFNTWYETTDYIRSNISQQMIRMSYLVLLEVMKIERDKIEYYTKGTDTALFDKYINDLDIFWYALNDQNAMELELIKINAIHS